MKTAPFSLEFEELGKKIKKKKGFRWPTLLIECASKFINQRLSVHLIQPFRSSLNPIMRITLTPCKCQGRQGEEKQDAKM
jgi:hypothetical protein